MILRIIQVTCAMVMSSCKIRLLQICCFIFLGDEKGDRRRLVGLHEPQEFEQYHSAIQAAD